MTRVCITTVVDGEFQRYVPLFILSALTAYPDYSVRVFVRDELDAQVPKTLFNTLCQCDPLYSDLDWCVITGALDGYPDIPRLGAHLRYLLFTPERAARDWDAFDYVYITDADMLIVRQDPPLHVQHIKHMAATGLCYSDVLRAGEPNVVTGLLFASWEFIQRVGPTVATYDAAFRELGEGVLDTAKRIPDERLLYQIIRDSGVGLPPQRNADTDPLAERMSDPANYRDQVFRPWHGLNIGAGMAKAGDMVRLDLPYRREAAEQLRALVATPAGQACAWLLNSKQHRALLKTLALEGLSA